MRPVDPRIETMAMALWAAQQWGPRVAWSTVEQNWERWHRAPWRSRARDVLRLLDKAGLRQGVEKP